MSRVLIAGLFHETHTFLDGTTPLSEFQVLRGAEMLACAGDSSPLGGVLECAQEFDWEVVLTVDYRAQPSAMVEDVVIESFWAELEQQARPALAGGIAAIYLVLHGAMVSESFPDVEGEILERLRALPGAADLPLFGVFDLHANFTLRMARLA
ncbi:MAG: MlrC domain protein, partial [Verrucomicrobiaceae bacterium]|nr:MlrC domain protein [Verrucomicrobiaceae bacterium]